MLEYTNRRNKTYRIGIRIWGVVFTGGALLYLARVLTRGVSGAGFIGIVMAVVFLSVGFKYITQSLKITAYDLNYKVSPDGLILTTEKGRQIVVDYSDIKVVDALCLKEDMDYVILHIVAGRMKLDCHIEGQGDLGYQMRDKIREYVGLGD